MADIFDMDGCESHLSNAIKNLTLDTRAHDDNPSQSLNYKLIDETFSTPTQNEDPLDVFEATDTINDVLSERTKPIHIKRRSGSHTQNSSLLSRPRRRSSIVSSYEVKIQDDYVSSTLTENHNTNPLTNDEGSSTYKPKLSDFEPIKVLGKGSYGKVLLVRDLRTGLLFAQKQLLKASMIINRDANDQEVLAEDGGPKIHNKNYQRTLNEKQILGVVHHPNIVKLYYAFQDNNKLYLILEYLQGGELFHHLSMEKFMSEKNAAYYLAQCSLALHYLHTKVKVIYRDLKPENCMLNAQGNLVLTDFGLSKVASDEDKLNSITGTIQYMAPEVIMGEEYDYGVDWWSLGCVAYDLLTGAPPFTGSDPDKVLKKIKNSKKTLKFPFYLSNDAKDFLRKMLQVNVEKRFDVDGEWEKYKKHNFFRHVDWNLLEKLDVEENAASSVLPPILPIITDPVLAENFDDEFTEMTFTPQQNTSILKNTFHMKDFSYTNPKFMDNIKLHNNS
ncbi:hypothetical protein CORT_0A05430 [Candida orthopsilosis Co 90-125]|uniref:Uncharacterized protein n=1 Tax=Candida orthopsilosis (strain 90-125) TaxID=1136231 RepID=H8WXY3_CANO9|nr:hypothetical protein CORT_0A05430 [Candida orthopsilosis Co 90-125]CCG20930.1 hypothetical protein CORT_0A05430 [Candida orthopsilosis Co 90-125]